MGYPGHSYQGRSTQNTATQGGKTMNKELIDRLQKLEQHELTTNEASVLISDLINAEETWVVLKLIDAGRITIVQG
jgi:hypothetical protein